MTALGQKVSTLIALILIYLGSLAWLWQYVPWTDRVFIISAIPLLVWMSAKDLSDFELPDIATFLLALIGGAYVALLTPQTLVSHLISAILVAGVLWGVGEICFRRFGREALGIGDAKLFGAATLWLGPWHLPDLFLLSALGGITFSVLLNAHGNLTDEGIPFGPFIAYALFVLIFLNPIFL